MHFSLPILHAQHIKLTKSILHPLLALTLIVWTGSLGAIAFAPEWVQRYLVAGMAITLIADLCAYAFFAVRDPDRLHSEQHREVMRHFDLLGDSRGIPGAVIEQLPPVANTQVGQPVVAEPGRPQSLNEGRDG